MRSATFTLDGAILRNGLPFLEFEDAEIGVRYSYLSGGEYDWQIESIGFSVLDRRKSKWTRQINELHRCTHDPLFDILAGELEVALAADIESKIADDYTEAISTESRGDQRYHEERG